MGLAASLSKVATTKSWAHTTGTIISVEEGIIFPKESILTRIVLLYIYTLALRSKTTDPGASNSTAGHTETRHKTVSYTLVKVSTRSDKWKTYQKI